MSEPILADIDLASEAAAPEAGETAAEAALRKFGVNINPATDSTVMIDGSDVAMLRFLKEMVKPTLLAIDAGAVTVAKPVKGKKS